MNIHGKIIDHKSTLLHYVAVFKASPIYYSSTKKKKKFTYILFRKLQKTLLSTSHLNNIILS